MKHHCRWLAAVAIGLGFIVQAADPEVDLKELPRIPPTEPGQAPATFRVKSGFRVELVAAEPLVVSPVALSFDEAGRMFVVEMRDYSELRDERMGRIRRLEDTDGDGRFDRASVYADQLPWPTAVICYDGGVFIGATPDILFCKDTNGDGVADLREVVFTGFASDFAPYQTNKLNVQAMLNSFNWGLDNRIHGATSMSGGKVQSVKSPASAPLDLRGRDFAFDPRTLVIAAEPGGAQHGMSIDNTGRRFVSSNSDHIQAVMYEDRYSARNPAFLAPNPRVSIAVDGPAAEVFRISPDEPWRVIRTRWRVSGQVPGLVEGGGRPSGYFTGATGVTIYRGHAWPEEFLGDAFIADCGSNLVHRKKLRPDDVSLKAERPADEQKVEFLASTDNWFRPVQFANAPDGTLYVIDMYREIIEHPWSLPPTLKRHLDLNSGNDRGRIYRIVADGFQQPKPPQLGRAATKELAATLEHPNGWHRDAAARLLFERQDLAAVPELMKLMETSRTPLGRMHALYALDGLGRLSREQIIQSLADADGRVRAHAVRLAERFSREPDPGRQLGKALTRLAADPDPRVRYQLAFSLGEFQLPERIPTLAEVVRRDAKDPWVQTAVLTSLTDGAGDLFGTLAGDGGFGHSPGQVEFLRRVLELIGAQNRPREVTAALASLAKVNKRPLAYAGLRALGDGLQRAGSSLQRADTQGLAKALFAQAIAAAQDHQLTESIRVEAVQLLAFTNLEASQPILVSLLELNLPQAIQLAAVSTLARFAEDTVGGVFIQRWPKLTPKLRMEVLAVMFTRAERLETLLSAMEKKIVLSADLTTAQQQSLRTHRHQVLRERAIKLLGSAPSSQREEVVKAFSPALNLAGNVANGKRQFTERCASCHRLGGEGHPLGPDLATVKSSGKEKLLSSVLDPNREVTPGFLNYSVETKDGESLAGLIASESSTSITLRGANGYEVVLSRSRIQSVQSSGQSVMPDGLETGLTPQDLADLLEFIMAAEGGK